MVRALNERLYRAYRYAFGLDPSGIHATSQVLRGGEDGELAEVRVNHSRALVNTLLNLIVAPKIVWQPKAVNVDYDSVRECNLASAILEFFWTEKQVSKYAIAALESALFFKEGFVLLEWDPDAGDDYAALPSESAPAIPDLAPTGDPGSLSAQLPHVAPPPPAPAAQPAVVKGGDVRFTSVQPWDVIRDPTKQSWDQLDWVIVRLYRNRFDLAAQYPEHAEEIRSAPPEDTSNKITNAWGNAHGNDDVACYYFFHKRTPSVPDGREVVLIGETVLRDVPLSYESVPLYRVSAGEMIGTPYGYSAFEDILGVQELMDSLHTAIASNQTALATQCVVFEEGTDIDPQQVVAGMQAIYKQPGAADPKALQLTSTPAEVFNHLGGLKKDQELLFGLNSVVRGEPQGKEMSGSALALLQSQALQQSSVVQGNYLRFVEGIGTCLLSIIRNRAQASRTVAIVGKSNQFLVTDTEYSGKDIGRIKKVQVEIGNPLAQTSAGRTEMAKELMQMGLVKTVEQYHEVLQTGRLEPLTQSLTNELLLIRSENEQLTRAVLEQPQVDPMAAMLGLPPPEPQLSAESVPPVLLLDDHMLHAREHRSVLANPEARRNPAVVRAVLQHIADHEQAYYTAPPPTLMLVGQQPPMMPMGPPPGAPGGAPPADAGVSPPGGSQPGDAGPPPAAPPGAAPGGPQPKLPDAPKQPATGRKWNPLDAGGVVPR